MMDGFKSGKFEEAALARIARRPWLAGAQGGALGFADRDHLPRMQTRQFAPAGAAATPADLRQVLANLLLCLGHFNVFLLVAILAGFG